MLGLAKLGWAHEKFRHLNQRHISLVFEGRAASASRESHTKVTPKVKFPAGSSQLK